MPSDSVLPQSSLLAGAWARMADAASPRTTGGQYSVFRALLGAYLVVHFGMLLPYASEVFAHAGTVADGRLSPLFGVLPNPLQLGDGPTAVTALIALGMLCGLAVCAGRFDRVGGVLAALVLGWLFQRNPLIANPSLPLLGWMLVMHAFVPPRPFGSLAGARNGTDPDWRLPRHLFLAAWIMLALSYSYSGWTKLASPSWVDGDTIRLVLQNPLARDHLLREWLLATPPIVLQLLTWSVLWIEVLFAPLALSRRLRPWLWLLMLLAQSGFLIFLDFADLTFPMLLVHLLTFDPAWLSRWERKDPAVVLFDGGCAFCHMSVRLALHEDAQRRLCFAPLGGATASSLLAGRVPDTEGDSIVVVAADGRLAFKSRAVAAVLERLGGVWLLIAIGLRATPRAVADVGYDLVGRWRIRIAGRTDMTCPLFPAASAERLLP